LIYLTYAFQLNSAFRTITTDKSPALLYGVATFQFPCWDSDARSGKYKAVTNNDDIKTWDRYADDVLATVKKDKTDDILQTINNTTYFSPCSVSFVLSGEYIQYSPLINFRLIIPSNIHLQLIIPSNIHLQCLCSTKNEKKTTSRRKFGIENYFYSESLTQPRNVKNKYVILRHLGDMCLFTSALRASVNKSHIPSLPQNNLYIIWGAELDIILNLLYNMLNSKYIWHILHKQS
jgi:hypothetical protein